MPDEDNSVPDGHSEFKTINTEILGVSVDSQFSHLEWIQAPRNDGGFRDLEYPLVSDLKRDVSTVYNVLSHEGVALQGLFIIDKEGAVQHATINNLAFGRNVDETPRTVQPIQYVQENPDEVCPAAWQSGKNTIKPDPVVSTEYFADV